jgi:signal peptidase I
MNEQPTTTPAPITPSEPHKPAHPINKQKEGWHSAVATIAVLLIAPVVALLLTAFVFQSYQVDGESMQNTLQNNDRLIVWKMPRTWSRITGHTYMPNRGDIIIFNEQGLPDLSPTQSKQLVKRVIGLPGDHVVVKNGVITVYNVQHPNGFQPDTTLPYGKDSPIPSTPGAVDYTVGLNQVFVCGDNRGNSYDSRYFGPIAAKDIVGKLIMRILPIGKAERF